MKIDYFFIYYIFNSCQRIIDLKLDSESIADEIIQLYQEVLSKQMSEYKIIDAMQISREKWQDFTDTNLNYNNLSTTYINDA